MQKGEKKFEKLQLNNDSRAFLSSLCKSFIFREFKVTLAKYFKFANIIVFKTAHRGG